MSRPFSRRLFLEAAGALSALGVAPGFLHRAMAAGTRSGKTLVLVFLRGGADGLSIVPPVGDPEYRRLRPTLALQPPGGSGGALRLDDVFALHPALASLMPLWSEGTLGIVHAAGLTGATRSFRRQDFCESGARSEVHPRWLAQPRRTSERRGRRAPSRTVASSPRSPHAGRRCAGGGDVVAGPVQAARVRGKRRPSTRSTPRR